MLVRHPLAAKLEYHDSRAVRARRLSDLRPQNRTPSRETFCSPRISVQAGSDHARIAVIQFSAGAVYDETLAQVNRQTPERTQAHSVGSNRGLREHPDLLAHGEQPVS